MLRNGSQGDEVLALQKSLKAVGIDPGPVDGMFGPKTEAAVKACQEKCGVTADGIWGPASEAAFKEMTARVAGQSQQPAQVSDAVQEAAGEAAAEGAPEMPDLPDFA